MKRDLILPIQEFRPSFLSCEKDCETILTKIFITSQPYSDYIKRLLVINMPDCLDNMTSQIYKETIDSMSLAKLHDEGYIKLIPKIAMPEHQQVKSYILLSMDNFARSQNNEFRSCTINFDILSHVDCWDLGGFRVRPLKIAGYIDGILNKARLSGIGQLEFVGCKELLLDEVLGGYTLIYQAIHGSDDELPNAQ